MDSGKVKLMEFPSKPPPFQIGFCLSRLRLSVDGGLILGIVLLRRWASSRNFSGHGFWLFLVVVVSWSTAGVASFSFGGTEQPPSLLHRPTTVRLSRLLLSLFFETKRPAGYFLCPSAGQSVGSLLDASAAFFVLPGGHSATGLLGYLSAGQFCLVPAPAFFFSTRRTADFSSLLPPFWRWCPFIRWRRRGLFIFLLSRLRRRLLLLCFDDGLSGWTLSRPFGWIIRHLQN